MAGGALGACGPVQTGNSNVVNISLQIDRDEESQLLAYCHKRGTIKSL